MKYILNDIRKVVSRNSYLYFDNVCQTIITNASFLLLKGLGIKEDTLKGTRKLLNKGFMLSLHQFMESNLPLL